ncbi:MAG: undecaprenyl-diphosphate phosphatase [Pirellulaceae bacterium]|nr:undecaprenyl-diphosphate phosphatase [Planctomycetales bacterium]
MSLFSIVVLAIIQGVAEFLPISSSGHVVIASSLLELGNNLDIDDVNIVLHAGSLLSILVVYWRKIWELLNKDRRTIPVLLVATLPAVAIGLVIKKCFDHLLTNPSLAGAMLVVTGIMLLLAGRLRNGEQTYQELSFRRALAIGFAQAVAVLPGISRSGATISSGLAMGLTRQDAATFSFLMAIPVIAGASLLEIVSIMRDPVSITTSGTNLLVGAAISFVVGVVSLLALLRILERGRLQYFALWCIPAGVFVLGWQVLHV